MPVNHLHQVLLRRERFGAPINTDTNWPGLRYASDPLKVSYDIRAPSGEESPVYAVRFSNQSGHIVLVGDEDGQLHLKDTRPGALKSESSLVSFTAHYNAIFDVQWAMQEGTVISASGDGVVGVFDVETQENVARCVGHTRSAKSVHPSPGNPNLIASGGRDGMIFLWDLRDAGPEGTRIPVSSMNPSEHTKERQISRKVDKKNPRSVTSVLFLPTTDTFLFSAGDGDGLLSLWDLRQARIVSQSSPCMDMGIEDSSFHRSFGISSIDIDYRSRWILLAATNSRIYVKNLNELDQSPIRILYGHTSSCYYIKSRFSRVGSYVISGSSDQQAYLWDLNSSERTLKPCTSLQGHMGEVTAVDSSPADRIKFVTCSDDSTFKIWTL